jgi:hypothetical protein
MKSISKTSNTAVWRVMKEYLTFKPLSDDEINQILEVMTSRL